MTVVTVLTVLTVMTVVTIVTVVIVATVVTVVTVIKMKFLMKQFCDNFYFLKNCDDTNLVRKI